MESQFKKDSWVWIEGLLGAKELNGKLGQIVKYRLIILAQFLLLKARSQWPYGLKNHSLHYWRAPRATGVPGVSKNQIFFL